MKDLQSELKAAASGLSRPSQESGSVAKWRDSKADEARRDLGFGKLFAMFPPPPDMEASVAAYIEQTRDIPWLFVSHALKRLVDRPVFDRGSLMPRKWLPTISEVRYEAARVVREFKLKSEGRDAREYSVHGDFALDIDRWIEKAPEVLQVVERQKQIAARPDRKQLAAGER
jgi:hypothetical protein